MVSSMCHVCRLQLYWSKRKSNQGLWAEVVSFIRPDSIIVFKPRHQKTHLESFTVELREVLIHKYYIYCCQLGQVQDLLVINFLKHFHWLTNGKEMLLKRWIEIWSQKLMCQDKRTQVNRHAFIPSTQTNFFFDILTFCFKPALIYSCLHLQWFKYIIKLTLRYWA